MCVGRVEEPLRLRERSFVHREADELDAQAAPAMFLEHVDVREVGLRVAVRERAREPDLLAVAVEADDAGGTVDQLVLDTALASLGPVRLLAEISMDCRSIDARGIVVELLPVPEIALHGTDSSRVRPVENLSLPCCTLTRRLRTRPGSDPTSRGPSA